MPVLQGAQEIYGYLPLEVQQIIADKMAIPLGKIFGVVTFYSFYSLQPKGKYRVSVCLGTACYVKGSGKFFEKVEETSSARPRDTSTSGQSTPSLWNA